MEDIHELCEEYAKLITAVDTTKDEIKDKTLYLKDLRERQGEVRLEIIAHLKQLPDGSSVNYEGWAFFIKTSTKVPFNKGNITTFLEQDPAVEKTLDAYNKAFAAETTSLCVQKPKKRKKIS